MRGYKGHFITFESTCEGIGKTTQAHRLAEYLRRAGYEVVLTREPGGTGIGAQIRTLLLSSSDELSKATELFLFLADRSQNYKENIKPALKAGKIVICDRFHDSTLAYQGAGRGWKTSVLQKLHHIATGSLTPNLTVVLDGRPHIDRSSHNPDRIESEGTFFFDRVKHAMREVVSSDERYVTLHANVRETELTQQIVDVLRARGIIH